MAKREMKMQRSQLTPADFVVPVRPRHGVFRNMAREPDGHDIGVTYARSRCVSRPTPHLEPEIKVSVDQRLLGLDFGPRRLKTIPVASA
jgi:hypothetical protein